MRAVRLELERRDEYTSLWAAVEFIAPKIGCVPKTLVSWVLRHEVDMVAPAGVTKEDEQRMKELKRENKELHRTNVMTWLLAQYGQPMNNLASYLI